MGEGEVLQSGLLPNPVLTFSEEGITPDASGTDPSKPDQRQDIVGVSMPIPLWGTPGKARKAAAFELERRRAELDTRLIELRAEVKTAYFAVLYRQESMALMNELAETFDRVVEVSRARFEAGDIAEVEVIKAEANRARFAVKADAVERDLQIARVNLATVLGNPGIEIGICVDEFEGLLPELSEKALTEIAKDHPRESAWGRRLDSAEARIALARAKSWPIPSLGFSYRHFVETEQDTFDVTVEIPLPLFDRRQGEIRSALEDLRREEAAVLRERNVAVAELMEARERFEAHQKNVKVFRERILPKMEETLTISRESFAAGETSVLDVLDNYRSLSESRLTYLEELFNLRVALFDLERLAGKEF